VYPIGPTDYSPFPYQAAGLSATHEAFDAKGKRRALVTMATGLGKTILVGFILRDYLPAGRRCLFLAHTDDLIEQSIDKFSALGVEAATEKAERRALDQIRDAELDFFAPRKIGCVVGSVQSMKGRRLQKWPRDYFDLVICDECHHAKPGSAYHALFEWFHAAKILGVTATPKPADGTNLLAVFHHHAFDYGALQAVADGWLAEPKVRKSAVRVDLSTLKFDADDFPDGKLEDEVLKRITPFVRAIRENIGDRVGIVFTPGVESARRVAAGLCDVGVVSRAVWGDSATRDADTRDFKQGLYQCGVNCQVWTEGFDHPPVSFIGLLRATKSATLLAQKAGRGLRKYPGKQECLFLDFDWGLDRLQVFNPVRLFAPAGCDEATLALAEDLAYRGMAIPDALAEAKIRQEARRASDEEKARIQAERLERKASRLKVEDGTSGFTFVDTDPLGVRTVARLFPAIDAAVGHESYTTLRIKATPKQVGFLASLGVQRSEAEGWSRHRAEVTIKHLLERQKHRMATPGQKAALVRSGVPHAEADCYTQREASAFLDSLRRPVSQASGF
jgi:superfamily II DNA or RNA helicase